MTDKTTEIDNRISEANRARRNQPSNNMVILLPCCPHCSEELEGVSLYNWGAPGKLAILCVFCPHCRKSLHMQIVPAPEEAGMIARPS